MQNDQVLFENFISKKWKTVGFEHQRNGDIVYYKEITKNGIKYYISARFTKVGAYSVGYLTDENGTAIINGKGFTFDVFMNHLQMGLKAI